MQHVDTLWQTINYSAEEWVNGDVHTNTVENVWRLFKRSVMPCPPKRSPRGVRVLWDNQTIRRRVIP